MDHLFGFELKFIREVEEPFHGTLREGQVLVKDGKTLGHGIGCFPFFLGFHRQFLQFRPELENLAGHFFLEPGLLAQSCLLLFYLLKEPVDVLGQIAPFFLERIDPFQVFTLLGLLFGEPGLGLCQLRGQALDQLLSLFPLPLAFPQPLSHYPLNDQHGEQDIENQDPIRKPAVVTNLDPYGQGQALAQNPIVFSRHLVVAKRIGLLAGKINVPRGLRRALRGKQDPVILRLDEDVRSHPHLVFQAAAEVGGDVSVDFVFDRVPSLVKRFEILDQERPDLCRLALLEILLHPVDGQDVADRRQENTQEQCFVRKGFHQLNVKNTGDRSQNTAS